MARRPLDPSRWGPLSAAREVSMMLPVAFVLILGLSLYTLFSVSGSLELLAEERRGEAARLARHLAERLDEASDREAELIRFGTQALGAALVTRSGDAQISWGDLPRVGLLAPLRGRLPEEPVGLGFGPGFAGRVVGLAPVESDPGGLAVRIDLPAGELERQLSSLVWVRRLVLGVGAAVLILVLLSVRQLAAPIQRLLSQARRLEPAADSGEDEVGFLVRTFEKAVSALEAQKQGTTELLALERALSSSLDSGLLLLDETGRVLALNPFGAQLLGVPQPSPGLPLAELFGAESPLVSLLEALARRGGSLRRRELQLGRARVGLTAHPLRREDGSGRGYLVLFSDLTAAQLEDREARLADSLAQLGEMAAGVAHELRNGLATIGGYVDLAGRQPSAAVSHLGEIRRETDQLARVVDDFLAFARPGTARPEPVDFAALLARVAEHPSFEGCTIELRLAPASPSLTGDPQLLERALRNLVTNAIEAERRAGRQPPGAALSLAVAGDCLVIDVDDHGPGLPEEVKRRLFQPFASGHASGVGLGLALSHRIVSLHGGQLTLGDRPGGGTRARLVFPIQVGADL